MQNAYATKWRLPLVKTTNRHSGAHRVQQSMTFLACQSGSDLGPTFAHPRSVTLRIATDNLSRRRKGFAYPRRRAFQVLASTDVSDQRRSTATETHSVPCQPTHVWHGQLTARNENGTRRRSQQYRQSWISYALYQAAGPGTSHNHVSSTDY